MARMEYKAECLCGGKIKTTFKKPTRMQHSVSRAACDGCGSDFLFTFSVEYHNGKRAYVPEHEIENVTAKLSAAIHEKRKQMKEVGVSDAKKTSKAEKKEVQKEQRH